MRVVRVITRLNIGGPSIQAITLSDRLRADLLGNQKRLKQHLSCAFTLVAVN